jgi:hypothetical protein
MLRLTPALLLIPTLLLPACSKEEPEVTDPNSAEQDNAQADATPAQQLANALGSGNAESAKALLAEHQELLATPLDERGNMAVHIAVSGGNLACLQAVLEGKPAVDITAGPGGSPASFMVFDAYPPKADLLQALLDAGASPTLTRADGTNLLLAACRNAKTSAEALQILVNAGTDPRVADGEGLTPLHWVVINDRADLAAVMMAAGLNPEDESMLAYGLTPLDMAMIALYETAEDLTPAQFTFANSHGLINRGESPLLMQLTMPVTPTALIPAQQVVEAWLQAVIDRDRAAADALGTEDFREKEESWKPSFTNAFFVEGATIGSYEIMQVYALEGEDTGQAMIRVRAKLERADGSEDGEGLNFLLEKSAAGWKISELD